jgi:GntR family transcriptional regulator, rspAB operon transcriptional repressor
MTVLEPISAQELLKDKAYQSIKEAILFMRLTPGESLVEAALAKQLGISKTPIRDALQRLEREGFVTVVPFKGAQVKGIWPKDLWEIFQLREVLEGLVAREAAKNLTGDGLKELRHLIGKAEQAIEVSDFQLCSMCIAEFHERLASSAGNERLTTILANLHDHLIRFGFVSSHIPGRTMKSSTEHRDLLDAIESGDPDRAETTMRRHIRGLLEEFLKEEEKGALASYGVLPSDSIATGQRVGPSN